MKLLNYTTSYFAVILLVLLAAWAVIFYLEMLDEIYDSMDDGLENQKMLVINKASRDSLILNTPSFEDGYYTIHPIDFNQAKDFRDSYRDTLMYMENEDEMEPVRLLESAFEQEGKFYKVKVITSMVEEDDLIEDLLYSLLWLYLGLVFTILILNNLVLRKLWEPFYSLLRELKRFKIEQDHQIAFVPTKIEEFQLLNERIEQMLQKSVATYREQKQFIENASHELQTPLAISINKLELLAEENSLKEDQLHIIGAVLNNLERLTRFNKALLLLSKIENRQFVEEELINFNKTTKELIHDYADLAEHRQIKIVINEDAELDFKMNRDLSMILISNLIKNALVHGTAVHVVEIEINSDYFLIRNFADSSSLEDRRIFSRFQKNSDSSGSTGLGLAIAKAIADRYGIRLDYSFQQYHQFALYFNQG